MAALDHFGDDANAPELAVAAGQQEDTLLLADVDRQGRGHGGENDVSSSGISRKAIAKSNFCS